MLRSTVIPMEIDRSSGSTCEQCAASCPIGAIAVDRKNQLKLDMAVCEKGQTYCGLPCMHACPQKVKAS